MYIHFLKKKNKTVISYSEINLSNNAKKIYFNNKIKTLKKILDPIKFQMDHTF